MAQALHPLKTWNDLDGPPGLPVAGNLFQLDLDTLHRTLEQWADRHDGTDAAAVMSAPSPARHAAASGSATGLRPPETPRAKGAVH